MTDNSTQNSIEDSDFELLTEIRGGSYAAFKLLFQRYYSPFCRYACYFLDDEVAAEDIVQDIFLGLWEKRKSIQITDSVKFYLSRSIRNKCLNIIKHSKIKDGYSAAIEEKLSPEIDQIEYEYFELRLQIENCIEKLPPRCQEIFQKSRFEQLKQKEIAEEMDISIRTVKVQINKALQLLRDCVSEFFPDIRV